MDLRRVTPVCLFLSLLAALPAQDFGAVAEQYVLWAEEAIAAGRWDEALTGLERAAGYADISSDVSYLLARARIHTGKPRGAALEALRRASEARRWSRYTPEDALLLEAETLIALRNFSGALNILAGLSPAADQAVLRLRALRGLPDTNEFRRVLGECLERYPRDPRPALLLFEYARGRTPEENDQALMDLALSRLSYLVEAEPRLAFLAAPFIKDREEARRFLAAYRSVHEPLPASVPVSLSLGLIDEAEAVEEFFAGAVTVDTPVAAGNFPVAGNAVAAGPVIDRDLARELFNLLKEGAARNLFRERLLRFSGLVTADEDRDGFPESAARYRNGGIGEYAWDADQDGLAELRIVFDPGGNPQWAEQIVLPDADPAGTVPATGDTAGAARTPEAPVFAVPVRDEDRTRALVFWERYPGVLRSELEGVTYIPPPGEFLFTPIRFISLAETEAGPGLPWPVYDPLNIRISRRTLVSFSVTIRRPSGEFEGAVEWIDLRRGIPLRAAEILDGRPVSVTEFSQGKPRVQRIDLDVDGRMETIRRFRDIDAGPPGENLPEYKKIIESSESDWDGDGIFETGEQYLSDGTVVYSWDVDGDGVREYSETGTQ
jgi:tetratricopeptide (TPR) repeat protein